jgi:hypothetical protein
MDRGRRELPIEAQFVGKRIATSTSEIVSVTFLETDGVDDVWLLDRETPKAARGVRKAPKAARTPPSAKRPKRPSKK